MNEFPRSPYCAAQTWIACLVDALGDQRTLEFQQGTQQISLNGHRVPFRVTILSPAGCPSASPVRMGHLRVIPVHK